MSDESARAPRALPRGLVIDVRGARVEGRRIRLVAVDSLGGAIVLGRADGEQFTVAIKRNRDAELGGGPGVGSLDVGRRIPGRAGASVNVDRAGVFRGGVRLIPVDALGAAVLEVRADGDGVPIAADGHCPSELVVLPRIESLYISLLRPLACRTLENVGAADGVEKFPPGAGIDLGVLVFHSAGDNGVAIVADGH